jgi:hypothetical protein
METAGCTCWGSALVAGGTVNGPDHKWPPSRENTRLGNVGEVDRQAPLGGLIGPFTRAGVRRSPAAADRLGVARILGAGAQDLPGQIAPAQAAQCLLLHGEVVGKHQTSVARR